jgi:hypothetical protein
MEKNMDDESLKKLRLDKRLVGRRGWIAAGDLQSALEALPDASDKIAPPSAEPGESSATDESA